MDDAAFEAQRARVMAVVLRWKPIIAPGWFIDCEWSRGPYAIGGVAEYADASITAAWDYMEATVKFDLARVAVMPDDELDRLVIHEMAHILTAPLVEASSRAVLQSRKEHATTMAQHAIYAAYVAGREAGPDDDTPSA